MGDEECFEIQKGIMNIGKGRPSKSNRNRNLKARAVLDRPTSGWGGSRECCFVKSLELFNC